MGSLKTFKRILCIALLLLCQVGLICCTGKSEQTGEDTSSNTIFKPMASEEMKKENDITQFELDKYLSPIWEGDISYAESAFVRQNKDGEIDPIKLLYPIEKIISVRSSDLKTEYIYGTDYTVNENGELIITDGGSIPFLKYDDYFFPLSEAQHEENKLSTKFPAANHRGMGYIRAEIGTSSSGMATWSLAVTYSHSSECVVKEPTSKRDTFKGLIEKLERGEDITVVATGDSITDGWSSSGKVGIAPNCPQYNLLFEQYIEKTYNVNVDQKNVGVSGSVSSGGVEKLDEIVSYSPDLVIIAFGMNDGGGTPVENYISNINQMVSRINTELPDAYIIVVSTCLPNEELSWSVGGPSMLVYHKAYAPALCNEEKNWTNAAVANVTQANIELFERKVYQDVAGSNSNHPNDYMHRIYAQVIIQTVFGK